MRSIVRGFVILGLLLFPLSAATADEVGDLVAKLGSGNSADVQGAAKALGRMGGGAAGAIGPLFDILTGDGDPKSKIESLKAVRSIGGADRGALVDQILEKDDIMGKIQGMASGRNPLLKKAAEGLGADSVGALTSRLGDAKDPGAQKAIIDALGDAGPMAKSAIPDLEKLAGGAADEGVRNEASSALKRIKG